MQTVPLNQMADTTQDHLAGADAKAGALSDERILHLWDTHVAYETGQSVKQPPLSDANKLAFARAVLNACGAPGMYEALRDMLAGWKYIRSFHGDLYGVGWDRAQGKAEAALSAATGVSQ
jgi:hypothetical protein